MHEEAAPIARPQELQAWRQACREQSGVRTQQAGQECPTAELDTNGCFFPAQLPLTELSAARHPQARQVLGECATNGHPGRTGFFFQGQGELKGVKHKAQSNTRRAELPA